MSIRKKAIAKMVSRKPITWSSRLTKGQSADLAILVEMVQNGEVSTNVAYEVWSESHPGNCKRSSFQSYMKEMR